jgi:hypothetical protein
VIEDRDPNVYKDNDYTPRLRLETDDDATGLAKPAAGITDLDCWISATEDGTEIHVSLKVRAVELTEKPGTYKVTIPGADITTRLFGAGAADFSGKDVYVIAKNVGQNVRGSERVKALKVRRMS